MLAQVACPQRDAWLEGALGDSDRAVRETATIAIAWVSSVRAGGDGVPDAADRPPSSASDDQAERALPGARGYEWEYTVEVWRGDGLQLGIYFVRTCEEDDDHARSIALGQAILANSGTRGDSFDPELAATFIVDKGRRPRGPTRA